MNQLTRTPDPVVKDHRQPGPPPSVAYRGVAVEAHELDVLAGLWDGGEAK